MVKFLVAALELNPLAMLINEVAEKVGVNIVLNFFLWYSESLKGF